MKKQGYYSWVEDTKQVNTVADGGQKAEPVAIKLEKGKYPDDIFKRATQMASDSWVSNILRRNKYSMNGAMIGLAGGFLLALFTRQSKLFFSIGGLVIGGLGGNILYQSNKQV